MPPRAYAQLANAPMHAAASDRSAHAWQVVGPTAAPAAAPAAAPSAGTSAGAGSSSAGASTSTGGNPIAVRGRRRLLRGEAGQAHKEQAPQRSAAPEDLFLASYERCGSLLTYCSARAKHTWPMQTVSACRILRMHQS